MYVCSAIESVLMQILNAGFVVETLLNEKFRRSLHACITVCISSHDHYEGNISCYRYYSDHNNLKKSEIHLQTFVGTLHCQYGSFNLICSMM